jgi:hypothetical protein
MVSALARAHSSASNSGHSVYKDQIRQDSQNIAKNVQGALSNTSSLPPQAKQGYLLGSAHVPPPNCRGHQIVHSHQQSTHHAQLAQHGCLEGSQKVPNREVLLRLPGEGR